MPKGIFIRTKRAWSYGLVKENDPRLAQLSRSKKGKAPRVGFKHTNETKRKISSSLLNHPCYKNKTRSQNISKAKKGKPQKREHVIKRIAASLKVVCQKPNNFERRCLDYLNVIYPGRFTYTGDGTCIINRRSADAIDLHSRTVALFNGVYWHLEKKGYQITEKNKRIVERIESKPFLQAGYKVIFLWENEV